MMAPSHLTLALSLGIGAPDAPLAYAFPFGQAFQDAQKQEFLRESTGMCSRRSWKACPNGNAPAPRYWI